MRGLFITMEGVDGSGKSTQANKLAEYLNSKGIHGEVLREPGTTEIGQEIRTLLKKPRANQIYAETELFLFQASRAQLVREIIKPKLESGSIIICDRFTDSTWAYQGYAGGVNLLSVEFTNNLASIGLKIDKTFYFALPVEIAMARSKARGGQDRIERNDIKYYEKVHAGYEELAKLHSNRIIRIDATREIEQIHQDVINEISKIL